jgi:hypothetical protein
LYRCNREKKVVPIPLSAVPEILDAVKGCQHETIACHSGSACVIDMCDPKVGDDACTTDTCDDNVGCKHDRIECDDYDACTDDECKADCGCHFTTKNCDDYDKL